MVSSIEATNGFLDMIVLMVMVNKSYLHFMENSKAPDFISKEKGSKSIFSENVYFDKYRMFLVNTVKYQNR